jgi:hypothetical protein
MHSELTNWNSRLGLSCGLCENDVQDRITKTGQVAGAAVTFINFRLSRLTTYSTQYDSIIRQRGVKTTAQTANSRRRTPVFSLVAVHPAG